MSAQYSDIYFIGIGGIGMSAIARYYKFKGARVSGYDRTATELTHKLEAEGIGVHYEDRPELIPQDAEHTLIVYTPAVPQDLGEMQYVLGHGYRMVKRSRILGEISTGQRCLAVAGTHGKTSTSTLLAHIITGSGEGCSAFLGGISKNYNSNLLISGKPTIVVEADEFDRSFLQLYPEFAVITAMDADHLDIYGDLEHYQQAFRDFASQVSGTLVKKYSLPVFPQDTGAKILSYSWDDERADFHAENRHTDGLGHFIFDLVSPWGPVTGLHCGVPGWVNGENSVAAAAIALLYGVPQEAIKTAVASFRGVKRRLDLHVNSATVSYIDDYAHHPEELAAAIASIRDIFPGRKLTAVFQPHLYTRTRDFAPGFAAALSRVDKLILLDIYPAREEPVPGVSSDMILKDVTAPAKVLLHKEELMQYLENEPVDVLATFGAGNVDAFIEPITKLMEERIAQ